MDIRYLKKIAAYIATVAISVMFIIYILYHLTGEYNTAVQTVAAEYVTMEQVLTVDASFLREEKVLYATEHGSVNFRYNDGDKVGVGETVASIYADDSIGAQLVDIDERISVLEKSSFSDVIVLSDTATIDTNIDSIYYSMLEKIGRGDFNSALMQSDELLVLMNKRSLVTKEETDYSEKIALLRSQRELLAAAAGNAVENIVTGNAGYFYTSTDGYEGIYTSEGITDMQMKDYDLLQSSLPNTSVYEGDGRHAVGKLVTDYKWYIACTVSKVEYRSISTDKSFFSVVFPASDDKKLEMELVRVVNPADDDRVLLIFSASDMPENFDYSRHQTVDIIIEEYSGYRVPVSSVRLENGVKGVYILDSSTVYFREINPLFERDGWVICEEKDASDEAQKNRLSLYDFVITEGKDLYDGKKLS